MFAVIFIALLIVPAGSNEGDAGATTDGSNETCRSYEITRRPVKSPTVIGIETIPGVAEMFGKDTCTAVGAGVAVFVRVGERVGVFVDVSIA